MLCYLLISFISINYVISETTVYKGKNLGKFSRSQHNVKGTVYVVDENTLFIEGFSYDGSAPDAFFWAGSTKQPSTNGFIVPDALGRQLRLTPYSNQNVILRLPAGKTIKDIKWFAIWCRLFTANLGEVQIPPDFEPPREVNLGKLPNYAHGVRADAVIIKDAKTIQIKNLYYDGAAPDAFFLVGKGNKPSAKGTKVPDENGSLKKIHGYTGQDITLRLPGELTVFDIDWFALYCITYTENFGNVLIPKNLNVPPDLDALESQLILFSDCETIFPDLLEVSWEVRNQDIYIQLEGKVAPNQYLSFGLSGNFARAQMVGADVAVAYYDSNTGRAIVNDYILTSKAQCAPQSGNGACLDNYITKGKQNIQLVSSKYSNGILKVVYKRKLDTGDDVADQAIVPDMLATIVAAIGPLNDKKEVAFHHIKYTRADEPRILIAFNRTANKRNCQSLMASRSALQLQSSPSNKAWKQAVIENEKIFRAQIGPAGGDQGYTAITGIQSWGVAWYINGYLIPEIHVKRNETYTFVVEGGQDSTIQASYHPLYITNNARGGGAQTPDKLNTPEHIIYAGVNIRGKIFDPAPGAGRYCEWKPKDGIDRSNEFSSFEQYKQTLKLECENGQPATFVWTPDENTPDVVYYQCFTHRNLGWKIYVSGVNLTRPSLMFLLVLIVLKLLM